MAKHVLGIAAKRFPKRQFGEQTSYLRGLVRIARAHGLVAYVFTPAGIDWERRRVRAWTLAGKRWRKRSMPFPTVVHDRMWGLSPELYERLREDLDRLERLGIPVFNPDFGDKHSVYTLLVGHAELAEHLPETRLFDKESLEEMASRHEILFIKPVRGRQGKGIYHCRTKGGKFALSPCRGRPRSLLVTDDAEAVVQACAEKSDQPFIVQQGLDLVKVNGGAVDLRAIVQRDGRGNWRVSGIGCRVGARGKLVSNLHAGGRAYTLAQLERSLPQRLRRRLWRRRLYDLALATARALGEHFPHLGEIGLDMGLDTNGRLWILEVNRQPGRALFSRARLGRAWRLSRRRVVSFARYLSARAAGRSTA